MIPKRILVPVDFSPCSDAALDHAASLAKHLGAALDALHVWQTPDFVAPEMMVTLPGEPPLSFAAVAERQARGKMDELVTAVAARSGVTIGRRVEFGEPYATILDLAESGYDMIVMGTHGRTGLSRLTMGSIAEKIIRASPCPVLTIRMSGQGADVR